MQYLFLIVKQTYVVCRIKQGRKPYISSIRLLTILTLLFKFANLKVNMCKKNGKKREKNKKETKKVKKEYRHEILYRNPCFVNGLIL